MTILECIPYYIKIILMLVPQAIPVLHALMNSISNMHQNRFSQAFHRNKNWRRAYFLLRGGLQIYPVIGYSRNTIERLTDEFEILNIL